MNIGKGKRANILSLGTYAAVGNGINLKKNGLRSSQTPYLTAEQRGMVFS